MVQQKLAEVFKAEYSNLVAVLCHFYGLDNIQLAEDMVSETFLQAMKSWSHNGIPDSPKSWLRKVATNKLKDHFRRDHTFQNKIKLILEEKPNTISDLEISEDLIADSLLNMIFAICNQNISLDSQICLALRLLCGFSIDQIADAMLSNKESINKKLYRGKQKFKEYKQDWNQMNTTDYQKRLNSVLRIIYLIFNEGYYSRHSNKSLRQDICWDAMRLAIFLTKPEFLAKENTYALIALMCYHASRFNSRIDQSGQIILLESQNRQLWNKQLILKGNQYLGWASSSTVLSKYHLEASIAYWHTTDLARKWENILNLYNKLLTLEASIAIQLNRLYALAKVKSPQIALEELLSLEYKESFYSLCLTAELYGMDENKILEQVYLEKALLHAANKEEEELIKKKLKVVTSRN